MPGSKTIKKFIVFGQPNISEEEISEVTDVLKSGWIGTGKVCKDLENEFVRYMGGGYAVAVSSASIGLTIALQALGICRGMKVLTSPLTFCATVNAILHVGALPVFKDVEKNGCIETGMDFISKNKINAYLPVNYTGFQSSVIGWNNFAIPIIEDAAHSFGGRYLGKKQGSFGDVSVFSLYATKNITSGEGGIIFTKDKSVADRCRMLSQQGQSSGAWGRYSSGPINNYKVIEPGFKGNLPDVLAAIALVQLRRWPELKAKREAVWNVFEKAFGKKETGHSRHLFTIQVENREMVREELYNRGIGTGIHYGPLHLEPAYSFLGYKKGDFPSAERIGAKTLSLPVSNSMSVHDAERVAWEVKDVCDRYN